MIRFEEIDGATLYHLGGKTFCYDWSDSGVQITGVEPISRVDAFFITFEHHGRKEMHNRLVGLDWITAESVADWLPYKSEVSGSVKAALESERKRGSEDVK